MKKSLKYLIATLWAASILVCTILTWHITNTQFIQRNNFAENTEKYDPLNSVEAPPGAHILKIESKTITNYIFSNGTVITETDDSVTDYDN